MEIRVFEPDRRFPGSTLGNPRRIEVVLSEQELDSIRNGGSPRKFHHEGRGPSMVNPSGTLVYIRSDKAESAAEAEWIETRMPIVI